MKRLRTDESDANDVCPPPARRLEEEVVTLEETSHVLVRLPFLDFFRDAHLCELPGTPPAFSPDAFSFQPDTLGTRRPLLRLHTAAHGVLTFEGTWCDARGPNTAAPRSNRVVVELAPGVARAASGEGVEVASLLKHPAVGMTSDEARGRERARNAAWTYRRIDVPRATLVLRRIS